MLGASTLMPSRCASERNSDELVGVVEIERHRRRDELDRVMRLHVGGVVGHQRIGRGMALVEAVVGEFREQFEDRLGLPLRHVVLDRAGDEHRALLFHLGADLLAHRAAQQVGVAERIAGHDLRDLHHLFLVDDDAERLLQDRLQHRMQIFRLLVAMLARAIGRDVRHRARPVQRDQRDDVLEAVRAHVDQRAPHALTFHLEHADHIAAGQHLVDWRHRRSRSVARSTWMSRCLSSLQATSSTVSVFRPRKSNLTRPAGSTHFMLNWVTGMSDLGSR